MKNGIDVGGKVNEYRTWYVPTTSLFVYDNDDNKQKITKLFINGVEETIKFTMEDGTIIECTPNHKFLLVDGTWKCAKDITEIDDFLIK
jgi:intein/homing endonuclease